MQTGKCTKKKRQHIFHRVTVAVTGWCCSSEFWFVVFFFFLHLCLDEGEWKGEINVIVICGQLHCSVNCRTSRSGKSVIAVD